MPNLEQLISFHPGPQGGTSYFYLAQPEIDPKTPRVSMITIGKIRNQLRKRQLGTRPVTNLGEFLLASLPSGFIDLLEQAGVDVVEAWDFMVAHASKPKPERSMRTKDEAQVNRDQAERLARILATVAGGRKAPESLFEELAALMKDHGPSAVAILRDWGKHYGFSKRGQFVIVENRANRAAHAKLTATPKAMA